MTTRVAHCREVRPDRVVEAQQSDAAVGAIDPGAVRKRLPALL